MIMMIGKKGKYVCNVVMVYPKRLTIIYPYEVMSDEYNKMDYLKVSGKIEPTDGKAFREELHKDMMEIANRKSVLSGLISLESIASGLSEEKYIVNLVERNSKD